jgi:hypothetical protein
MRNQLERLDQASRLLDEVMRLPPGHPDRLRYLTLAEQSLEDRPPAGRHRVTPDVFPRKGPRPRKTSRSSA